MRAETGNIRRIMERYGRQLRLCLPDGWQSEKFGALIQPLRRRQTAILLDFSRDDRYLYIGPPEHDLTQLDLTQAWIQCGSECYIIERAEVVNFGDKPSHIWAIIRSVEVKE